MVALGVYHGPHVRGHPRGHPVGPATQFEAAVHRAHACSRRTGWSSCPSRSGSSCRRLTNESLNLLKNSSVALTISVAEPTFMTRQIETYTAKAIEASPPAPSSTWALPGRVARWGRIERRVAIPGLIVRGAAGELSLDFGVIADELAVPDRPGAARDRRPSGAGRWPGDSGHRSRLRPRGRRRARPPVPRAGSTTGHALRAGDPGRAAGHGGLLDLVHHPDRYRRADPQYWVALVAFVVFEAAYLGEIIRAGIQSVPAARSRRPRRPG